LITNEHVVDGCHEVVVRLADGRIGGASIVARSTGDDLAVLKVDMAPPAAAQFRAGQPVRLGEGVVVFGLPLVGSLGSSNGVLTTGHVSALAGTGIILASCRCRPRSSREPDSQSARPR
jgi:serine protease Do